MNLSPNETIKKRSLNIYDCYLQWGIPGEVCKCVNQQRNKWVIDNLFTKKSRKSDDCHKNYKTRKSTDTLLPYNTIQFFLLSGIIILTSTFKQYTFCRCFWKIYNWSSSRTMKSWKSAFRKASIFSPEIMVRVRPISWMPFIYSVWPNLIFNIQRRTWFFSITIFFASKESL